MNPSRAKKFTKTGLKELLGACGVFGFGSQGSALALNLRDSGLAVTVGLPPRSKSRRKARAENITVTTISKTAQSCDTLVFAIPDHTHKSVFERDIAPALHAGQTLVFLHGTSVAFDLVTPPADVDVILFAPHGPGLAVREQYISKQSGMSAFWSVAQDHSQQAHEKVFAFAQAVGIGDRKKLIKTTFRDEAVGDLFGEQAVLCGGLTELIHSGFQTLLSAGLSPESAYLEVCYQLDLIVDLIKRFGIEGMYKRISVAAKYGSLKTGPKLIDASVKKRMQTALKNIESGAFARELASLSEADIKALDNALGRMTSKEFERAARKYSADS